MLLKTILHSIGCFLIAITPTYALTLQSKAMQADKMLTSSQVFNGFGCKGNNLSPDIIVKDLPKNTKSLGVTVYDPDAPTGSGWWHWIAYNMPAQDTTLDAGASTHKMPQGTKHARNDYGIYDFGGACPPVGDKPHRYQLTLWALDIETLPIPKDASAALIGYFLNQHKIETKTIQSLYGR